MLTPHMLTTLHMLTRFRPSEKATYLMAQGFHNFFMTKNPTETHDVLETQFVVLYVDLILRRNLR